MSKKKDPVIEKFGLVNGFRPSVHDDHPLPVTRREFLRSGLITGSGLVYGPSLLTLLASTLMGKEANAYNCTPPGSGPRPAAFLTMEMSGGWKALVKNFYAGTDGNPTANPYDANGLLRNGVDSNGFNVTMVGGVPFNANSPLLRGMRQFITPAMESRLTSLILPLVSSDDTNNNQFHILEAISKVAEKMVIANMLGRTNSSNLMGSRTVQNMIDPTISKVRAGGLNDLAAIYQSPLNIMQSAPTQKVQRALASIMNLSGSGIQRLQQIGIHQAVTNLIGCQYQEAPPTANGPSVGGSPLVLNPNNDAAFTAIALGKNNPENNAALNFNDGEYAAWSTIMKAVIDGGANVGGCELGGYDYHNQTDHNIRDARAGMFIGALIAYAFARGVPLILDLCSDGAVTSPTTGGTNVNGLIQPTNDGGTFGGRVWLVFQPQGRLLSRQKNAGNAAGSVQIGSFGNNGVVSNSSPFSNNAARMGEFLVYLYTHLNSVRVPGAKAKFFSGELIAGGSTFITAGTEAQWNVFDPFV